MKLNAELDQKTHEIFVQRTGDTVYAEIDGRAYELEAHAVEPNVYLFKNKNKIYQIYVAPGRGGAAGDPVTARVGSRELEIKISDPKRLRGADAGAAGAAGAAEVKTAMPGKIVRVLVEAGAEIKQGDGVIIVEAMKMQNEMKSPKDGTVTEIRVAEGATVNAGDVLAVIE